MRRTVAWSFLALLLLATSNGGADTAEAFKVIVNVKVPGKAIRRESVADIFLGRADRWGDGRPVSPIDLSTTSDVRDAFTRSVLDMTILSVRVYWTRALSSGHYPPPTRTSDDEVVAYVSKNAGGIGYVSEHATLPDTVKVVGVQ
jgi:ABC-type phosphate transport system substrate-binding protein